MVWNYFSQFWNAIQEVVVGGAAYTIEWFQSIGNAVAGAIGSFFDVIVHYIMDLFILIGWMGSVLKNIFLALLAPINYIFTFIKVFFSKAFSSTLPDPEATYSFSSDIISIFEAIPHWTIFGSVLGAVLVIIIGIATLKLFLNT